MSAARGIALLCGVCAVLWSARAEAHRASISYSDVRVDRTRTTLTYQLRINSRDMAEPLGLPLDTDPTTEQITAGADRILDFVLARIDVETDGATCPIERRGVTVRAQRERFAEIAWLVRCPRPFRALAIDYDLFFDIDPLHTNNLMVRVARHDPAISLLSSGASRFVWDDIGAPPPSGFLSFVRSGIRHILYGFDHVAFVLALLLVAVITRDPDRTWRCRTIAQALRYIGVIITSFTLGHSITLASAGLGWQPLPGRFVESMIALSIVYVAVENIVYPQTRGRFLVAMGFGLMHGLGFASMLQALLPPEHVVAPLLAFNLGVELGQLAIVVVLIPITWLVAARLSGPDRYRAAIAPALSAIVALLGFVWLIERALGVTLLGL